MEIPFTLLIGFSIWLSGMTAGLIINPIFNVETLVWILISLGMGLIFGVIFGADQE